jgi:hypothetical protein
MNLFTPCFSLLFLVYTSHLYTVDKQYIHRNTGHVDVLKCIAGLEFACQLVIDGCIDQNERMERDPGSIHMLPAPSQYSVYQTAKILFGFGPVIGKTSSSIQILKTALRSGISRWGVARKLLPFFTFPLLHYLAPPTWFYISPPPRNNY